MNPTATPNADQVKAENEFVDFLLDPSEKEMRLIGPGGTGKSWLVHRLITSALKIYQDNCTILGFEPDYTHYVLTALTNKAAQSLQDATGLDVQTLHSFLSLTVKPNYSTGKQDLRRTSGWTIHEKTLVFIDESYMMDFTLLEELRMATQNCKLVFIGDDKQLDPVDASKSPIAELDVRTAELTIPVRNSGSPALQQICQILRDNVAGAVQEADGIIANHVWPMLPLTAGQVDHVDAAGLNTVLTSLFDKPNGNNLIVAFSNQKVNEYNHFLRTHRGQSHLFEVGEVMISNDLFERGRFRIRNEQTVVIAHADPFISWIKIGDLDVPTQYVEIVGYQGQPIPVIIDRDFHKEALKYLSNAAKAQKNWKPYYDLKDTFADFRPRDACTVHKSQGSTKDLVVVDLNNIGSCNFTVMTARMLYVAISRARHRVILYGNLPPKYGGVIL